MAWEIKKLEEVTNLITCGVAKRPEYVDEGIPFLSAKNVKNGAVVWKDFKHISLDAHNILTKHNKPQKGDILYTRVGSYGEAAIVDQDVDFSVFVSLTLIKPKLTLLNNFFLKYYLNSEEVKKRAKASINGVGVGNLNVGTVRGFPCPLPSLTEQKRIVEILDQAFADIAKARANAEKNLKNARELFESSKYDIFSALENKGANTSITTVCTKIYAGGDAPKGNFSKEKTDEYSIPIFANAVKNNGLYGYTDKSRANEPSLTVAARGSGTGHIEVRTEPFLPIVRLIVLTPNPELVHLQYFKYAVKNLDILRSGSAIPQLTVPMMKGYSLPTPTLDEQSSILERLNDLEDNVDSLKRVYTKKIEALDELKKSLLQKAFSGELTKDEVFA